VSNPDRTARRREALQATLAAEGGGAAALLVASETNVGYLTGFTGDSSVLLLSGDRALVVSDGRYTEQLRRECPEVEAHIRPVGQPLYVGVAEVVAKLGWTAVALEAAHISLAQFETLREKAPGATWKPVQGWVERQRLVKDEGEIAAIREAVSMAERAFARLRSGLSLAGARSEKDVADDLEFHLRRCGASASAFPPIVAAGPNAALPHYRPTAATRLAGAASVLIDWGATGRAYRSDLTRVLAFGPTAGRFEEVYEAVLAAQQRAITAIRPGQSAKALDTLARAALEEAGLAAHFTHSLGHGLGLELHELPFLGREPDVVLAAGMVFTVEPGVYLPGWGGVRIEDDVLVTPEGHEVLTGLARDLDAARLNP
jgi:Xaa-Pro aminopeptidase